MSLGRTGVIAGSYQPEGVDPDAQAFLDATGITDPTISAAINDLVVSAKANGWWTKCTFIYPMVGGSYDTCKYNLKDPQDTDGAYRLSENGTINYASTGVTGNGTDGYFDTHLTANGLSQDDYHISFYSRSDINLIEVEIGARTGNGVDVSHDCFLELRTLDVTYYGCNQGTLGTNNFISFSDTDSRGYYMGVRRGANDCEAYKNGSSQVASSTFTSDTLTAQNLYLLALNNAGTAALFSTKECAFATAGLSMDDTLALTMYNDIQTFQTALSRNV